LLDVAVVIERLGDRGANLIDVFHISAVEVKVEWDIVVAGGDLEPVIERPVLVRDKLDLSTEDQSH
jgi:hypothetical protein